jgi:uncharacterized Tic20 family protein
MNLRARQQALLCHLVALLWMPIALLIGILAFQWRIAQVMFIGSLSLAADVGHSANFVGVIWVGVIVGLALIATLWMPLAIALIPRKPDPFVRQTVLHVFNWLMTNLIVLTIATLIVTQLDRVTETGETFPWVSWSLIILIVSSAIAQLIFASIASVRSLQGKSFRYPFSLPILRSR